MQIISFIVNCVQRFDLCSLFLNSSKTEQMLSFQKKTSTNSTILQWIHRTIFNSQSHIFRTQSEIIMYYGNSCNTYGRFKCLVGTLVSVMLKISRIPAYKFLTFHSLIIYDYALLSSHKHMHTHSRLWIGWSVFVSEVHILWAWFLKLWNFSTSPTPLK